MEYSLVTLVEGYTYLASMSQNEWASGAIIGSEWDGWFLFFFRYVNPMPNP